MKVFDNDNQLKALSAGFGLAIFLAMVEAIIPKPIPFLRIGLANIPLVVLVTKLDFKNYMYLALLKVVGAGFVTGTVFSPIFLIAFCGTIVSALVMFSVSRLLKDKVSYLGLSIIGAFFSDIFRILTASLVLGNSLVVMIAPFILFTGILTSIFVGVFSAEFDKINNFENIYFRDSTVFEVSKSKKQDIILIILTVFAVLFFSLEQSVLILSVEYVAIVVISLILKKKVRFLLPFFVVIFVTFFQLLLPEGEILFNIGAFKVTKLALLEGVRKSLHFCGLISISALFIKNNIDVGNSINPVIRNGFFAFNKLSELKLTKKEVHLFNYVKYLNNADVSVKEKVTNKNFVIYITVSAVFFIAFIVTIFINPDNFL